MARLALALFGGFEAQLDGGGVLALLGKGQALLAYLALHHRQAAARNKLAALLWGGMGNEQDLRNLRHTVFTTRRTVGTPSSPMVVSSAG